MLAALVTVDERDYHRIHRAIASSRKSSIRRRGHSLGSLFSVIPSAVEGSRAVFGAHKTTPARADV